jgi:penicillin-binding protein 2
LQLATAAMLIANHGKWHQPAMIKRVGLDGEDINHPSAYPDIKLKNEDDWNFIVHAMTEVVHKSTGGAYQTGTAYKIALNKPLAYTMAGKSGTAQVAEIAAGFKNGDAVEEEDKDNALFIAFAPAEDPKIAVAVYVEHGAGGSGVAGPIARQILDAYLLGEDGQLKPEYRPQIPPAPALITSTTP